MGKTYKISMDEIPQIGFAIDYRHRSKTYVMKVVALRSYECMPGKMSTMILWRSNVGGTILYSTMKSTHLARPSQELQDWVNGIDESERPPDKSLNPKRMGYRDHLKIPQVEQDKIIQEMKESSMPPMKFRKKHVPRRRGDDVALSPGGSIQQTVRRDGKRVVIKQTMNADGKVKTTVTEAHTLESDLQAAQVSLLKGLPDYGLTFLLAGDQNAAKRGPVAAAEAKRTGMEAGEPDLRIFVKCKDGIPRTLLIENKNGGGYLSQEQKDRHEAMEMLGFPVWTIKTDDKDRAALCAMHLLVMVRDGHREPNLEFFPEISRFFRP